MAESGAAAARPIVLCPLEFERRALLRAGLRATFDLLCCGPGADGLARFAQAATIDEGRTVILAGLGGGLTETVRRGQACWITAVVDGGSRRRWRPPVVMPVDSAERDVVACSSPVTLTTPRLKADHRIATGADIVDRESAAFAAIATDRKWSWGIVRGISDGLEDDLPSAVDEWVDEAGCTRIGRVLWALVSSVGGRGSGSGGDSGGGGGGGPFLLPALLDLRARGLAAMSAVASALRRYAAA